MSADALPFRHDALLYTGVASYRAGLLQFVHDGLDRAEPVLVAPSWGPFTNVRLDAGVLRQFAEPPVEIHMQHHAVLVGDELFDRAYRLLVDRGPEHWADPQIQRPGETDTEHGGRDGYCEEPSSGHALELITRPYL